MDTAGQRLETFTQENRVCCVGDVEKGRGIFMSGRRQSSIHSTCTWNADGGRGRGVTWWELPKTKIVYFHAKCNHVVWFQLRQQPFSLKAIWKLHIRAPYRFFLCLPVCECPAAKPKICLGNSSAAHRRGALRDEGFFTFPSAWLRSHHIWKAASSAGCPSWTAALHWAAGEQVPRGTRRLQIQKVGLWVKVAKKFPQLSKHLTMRKAELSLTLLLATEGWD